MFSEDIHPTEATHYQVQPAFVQCTYIQHMIATVLFAGSGQHSIHAKGSSMMAPTFQVTFPACSAEVPSTDKLDPILWAVQHGPYPHAGLMTRHTMRRFNGLRVRLSQVQVEQRSSMLTRAKSWAS